MRRPSALVWSGSLEGLVGISTVQSRKGSREGGQVPFLGPCPPSAHPQVLPPLFFKKYFY